MAKIYVFLVSNIDNDIVATRIILIHIPQKIALYTVHNLSYPAICRCVNRLIVRIKICNSFLFTFV